MVPNSGYVMFSKLTQLNLLSINGAQAVSEDRAMRYLIALQELGSDEFQSRFCTSISCKQRAQLSWVNDSKSISLSESNLDNRGSNRKVGWSGFSSRTSRTYWKAAQREFLGILSVSRSGCSRTLQDFPPFDWSYCLRSRSDRTGWEPRKTTTLSYPCRRSISCALNVCLLHQSSWSTRNIEGKRKEKTRRKEDQHQKDNNDELGEEWMNIMYEGGHNCNCSPWKRKSHWTKPNATQRVQSRSWSHELCRECLTSIIPTEHCRKSW